MTTRAEAQQQLSEILAENDEVTRQLRLAALVSRLFRERGFEPVVVGGSAIEFYTEGSYTSGDIDICFDLPRLPSAFERAEVMDQLLGATGTTRTWKIGDRYLDILGTVEAFAQKAFGKIETPDGVLILQPLEDLVAERVFVARGMSQPDSDAEDCAKKLIAHVLSNPDSMDWDLAEKIAGSPAYRCGNHLREMKQEVAEQLNKKG